MITLERVRRKTSNVHFPFRFSTLLITLVMLFNCEIAFSQLLPRFNVTRPCLRTGIPTAEYQHGQRTASVVAMSNPSVSITLQPQNAIGGTFQSTSASTVLVPAPQKVFVGKLFQWKDPKLAIGHCTVSEMALQMFEDGRWVLSMRADQNPLSADSLNGQHNPTLHIKRNRFSIKVAGFAGQNSSVSGLPTKVGLPSVVQLQQQEFWVERREPRYVRIEGKCAISNAGFQNLDRVQLEFFVHK